MTVTSLADPSGEKSAPSPLKIEAQSQVTCRKENSMTKKPDNGINNKEKKYNDNQQGTPRVAFKSQTNSLSLVFSNCKLDTIEDCEFGNKEGSVNVMDSSNVRTVSRGRRRSEDKRYQPTRQVNNSGNNRGRRSSRSYQNYDNNSSNGNSGADGNGEDNDDSNDDDDEYNDDDDDDEEEVEEEEDDDENDDKNDDDDEDESSSNTERGNSMPNSLDEKLFKALQQAPSEGMEFTENNHGPIASGTPVTLQGIICHETIPGGVLVVNIKWRNKTYCGSLIDCSKHTWASPKFQSSDGSAHQSKGRRGKNNMKGNGKGKGKRLRSNSVSNITTESPPNENLPESPLKPKLRGRKKTMSGSSTSKGQGFRPVGNKRKGKNADEDSDEGGRPGKRSCTIKGATSPQPSPMLIECPEPGCGKKYKHINGLRYHQAHAHLEPKNQQDEGANSDDRSTTTPSPSDDFKEPDPRTPTKGRSSHMATRNRSISPSSLDKNADTSVTKDIANDNIGNRTTRKPKTAILEDKNDSKKVVSVCGTKMEKTEETTPAKEEESAVVGVKEETVGGVNDSMDEQRKTVDGENCVSKVDEYSGKVDEYSGKDNDGVKADDEESRVNNDGVKSTDDSGRVSDVGGRVMDNDVDGRVSYGGGRVDDIGGRVNDDGSRVSDVGGGRVIDDGGGGKDDDDDDNTEDDGEGDGEFVEVADKSTDTRTMIQPPPQDTIIQPLPPSSKPDTLSFTSMLSMKEEVPDIPEDQEVWETVVDSGRSGDVKFGGEETVNIEDMIAEGQDVEVVDSGDAACGMVADQTDEGRQVVLTAGSMNQLGIEVEDISENEEDIDPGQDADYDCDDEMNRALDGLQNTTFPCHKGAENSMQLLSSLKDPSFISTIPTAKNILGNTSATMDLAMDTLSNSTDAENTEIITDSLNSVGDSKEFSHRMSYMAMLGLTPEKDIKDELSGVKQEISIPNTDPVVTTGRGVSMETLVSNSLSASKKEPPLTNVDTPSMRFKYFTCRSYGDQTYTLSTSSLASTSTSTVTTLSLIRDPESLKGSTLGQQRKTSDSMETPKEGLDSIVKKEHFGMASCSSYTPNAGPNYTSSSLQNDCKTSSIHKHGPKENIKDKRTEISGGGSGFRNVNSTVMSSVIMSADRFPTPASYVKKSVSSSMSYSSPKSAIAVTSTKRGSELCASEQSTLKRNSKMASLHVKPTPEQTPGIVFNDSKDTLTVDKPYQDRIGITDKKTPAVMSSRSETLELNSRVVEEKATSRVLPRQPPTLIPKLNRLAAPSLPVGVAHPYPRGSQYNTITTTAAVTTGMSVTTPTVQSRPEPAMTAMPRPKTLDIDSIALKKARTDKVLPVGEVAQAIPVGAVDPVKVKRSQLPAIHAGLPSVIPVGAPGLKGQASLHATVRQGLKPPGQDDRVPTLGLGSRKPASPRPLSLSPRPVSTSPRPSALPSTKSSLTENAPVVVKETPTATEHAPKGKPAEGDDSSEDSDVVIVKEDRDVSAQNTSNDSEKPKGDRSPYDNQAAEQLKLFQLQQQRRLYQQLAQGAYLPSLGYDLNPWVLMNPEQQLQLMQQHQQQLNRAQERELQLQMAKSSRTEEPLPSRTDKQEQPIPSVQSEQRTSRTPTRPDKARPPSEQSPSSDSTRSRPSESSSSRVVPRLTPVEDPSSRVKGEEAHGRPMVKLEEPPEKRVRVDAGKGEEYSERELQRQKYRRHEEYLTKQMMQHKISMLKMESDSQQKRPHGVGGAAKTHSIRSADLKDRSQDEEDDHPRAKSPQGSLHSENISSRLQETNRAGKSSQQGDSEPRPNTVQEPTHKPSNRTSWSSRSPVPQRHSETSPDRPPGAFAPTQFQSYLQSAHLAPSQMLGQMNFDPSTGAPILPMFSPPMMMAHPLAMQGLMMGMPPTVCSGSSSTTTTSTATSLPPTRSREVDTSPYRGGSNSATTSPLTVGRSSRPRSPPRISERRSRSPTPNTQTPSRSTKRSTTSPSMGRSPFKATDKSPSVASRSIYRAGDRSSSPSYSRNSDRSTVSSPSVVSKSSFRTNSPTAQLHKASERVPSSSTSTLKVPHRSDRSASPGSSSTRAHGELPHRLKEGSVREIRTDNTHKSNIRTESEVPQNRPQGQGGHHEDGPPQSRGSIISTNLAVRRGDVTRNVMLSPPSNEELMRQHHLSEEERMRHQYMMYRLMGQQQQEAYAMMPSRHSPSRADQYYGKRQ